MSTEKESPSSPGTVMPSVSAASSSAASTPAALSPAVRSVIFKYYGFQIFFSLLLWIPVFYEFQKRIGLNDSQIFEIQSIYYIAFCLLEIPTGMLADIWSYRACMRLGAVLCVVANLLPVLAPAYLPFLAHFLLIALSRSLISGASSAYLYESLQAMGIDRSEFKRIEGNSRAYGLALKVLIWPVIGLLMDWKLSLPYTLSAIGTGIAVYYAWVLPPLASQKKSDPQRFFREIGPVAASLPRYPMLLLVMVQGLGVFILARICQTNLFQPILSLRGFPVSSYGAIMASATVFEALGSSGYLIRWMQGRMHEFRAVSVLTALMAITLAAIALAGPSGTIVGFATFSLFSGLAYPLQRQLMNDAISASGEASHYRATLLSAESILDRAACAWVVGWIGGFVSEGRIPELLQISAAICLFGVFTIHMIRRTRAKIIAMRPRA